jgi:uncharacterized NAD(P)/FAD-binding protein YdhS
VGGGFSGAALAIQLLRQDEHVEILLFEPGEPGRGVAYAKASDLFRLNVRASRMSMFPDRPDDFLDWARGHGARGASAHDFLSRSLYGDYVTVHLAEARRRARGRLVHLRTRVRDVADSGSGGPFTLCASDHTEHEADVLVIATGVAPPLALRGFDAAALASPAMIAVPWDLERIAAIGPDDSILCVGMGLKRSICCFSFARRSTERA